MVIVSPGLKRSNPASFRSINEHLLIYSVAAAATEVLKPNYNQYRTRNPLSVKKLAGTE